MQQASEQVGIWGPPLERNLPHANYLIVPFNGFYGKRWFFQHPRLTQMQLSKAFAGSTQPKFHALRIINELIIVQRCFIFSQSMIFYFPLTPKKEYSTFIEKHSYMLYFSKLHIIFVSQAQVFQRSFKQFIWVPIELIMLLKLILCHFCK